MATAKAKNQAPIGDPVGIPNTEPDGFELDRLTAGLHTSITQLHMSVGELKSSINAQTTSVVEIKSDIKEQDTRITDLKTEQVSTAKAIKLVGFIATPIIAAIAWFAPSYWNASMRPEMEKNIAAAVKADIEKEQAAREKTQALEKKISELQAKLEQKSK